MPGKARYIAIAGNIGAGKSELTRFLCERYELTPVLELRTDKLDWMTDLVDRVDLFRAIERHL